MKNTLKHWLTIIVTVALMAAMLSGCGTETKKYQKNTKLDTSENVRLVIVGAWKDCRSLELVAQKFNELYPNCTVEYEYLQDYSNNLKKRVISENDRVDLYISSGIQKDENGNIFSLDLLEYPEQVSLDDTFPGLVDNAKQLDDNLKEHLYSIPFGAVMRGLYVNKTLLSSLGIDIPTNRTELLAACKKLKEAGYIALQDNPATFAQRLLFPYIAHLVYDENAGINNQELLAACGDDAAEILRDPLEFLYGLVAENYYNYKYVEVQGQRFLDLSDEGLCRNFLNIIGTDGNYTKADDLGEVPFMPATNSLMTSMEKIKSDYHSTIEYEFILAPVSDEGGYAYMSPSNNIGVNKNSYHLDWTLEFMNFIFAEENNKIFAESFHITPNTKDALELISKEYNIPVRSIGQPANVTFGSYNFYNLIIGSLVTTAKANNPKYMQADGTMYPFEYYFNGLKEAFNKQRLAQGE